MFFLFYEVIVTFFFLVPALACAVYFLKGIILYSSGLKEKSTLKRQSALRTILVSLIICLLIVFCWYESIRWILNQEDNQTTAWHEPSLPNYQIVRSPNQLTVPVPNYIPSSRPTCSAIQ